MIALCFCHWPWVALVLVFLTKNLSKAYNTIHRELMLTQACFLCSMTEREHIGDILWMVIPIYSLRWRDNGRNSVSNHQPHDCLLNRLFRRRSKKTSKLSVTGLCARNSPRTGEFPARMASNAENVSIWWRHHVYEMKWNMCMCQHL